MRVEWPTPRRIRKIALAVHRTLRYLGDGTALAGLVWGVSANPQAIIRLAHGAGEHSMRYREADSVMERLLLHRVVVWKTGGSNAFYDDVDALPLLERDVCLANEHRRPDELYTGKATRAKSDHS
jgi:hypothetical protein